MAAGVAKRFVGTFNFATRQEFEDTKTRIANPEGRGRLTSRRAEIIAETMIELVDFDPDLTLTERYPLNPIDPVSMEPTIPAAQYFPELVFSTSLTQEDVEATYNVLKERMPQ